MNYDESKFRPKQREAALALVEYEFMVDGQRKSKQQVADELGVTRQTLHNWDTQDANFIAYKNFLASTYMDAHLAFVYSKLIDGIEKGSMKGIDIYLKRHGDLDRRDELKVINDGDTMTMEERQAALRQRLAEMNGED